MCGRGHFGARVHTLRYCFRFGQQMSAMSKQAARYGGVEPVTAQWRLIPTVSIGDYSPGFQRAETEWGFRKGTTSPIN